MRHVSVTNSTGMNQQPSIYLFIGMISRLVALNAGITDRMPKQLNGERILLLMMCCLLEELYVPPSMCCSITGARGVLIWRSYSIVVAANYLSNQIFLENLLVKTGSDGVNS